MLVWVSRLCTAPARPLVVGEWWGLRGCSPPAPAPAPVVRDAVDLRGSRSFAYSLIYIPIYYRTSRVLIKQCETLSPPWAVDNYATGREKMEKQMALWLFVNWVTKVVLKRCDRRNCIRTASWIQRIFSKRTIKQTKNSVRQYFENRSTWEIFSIFKIG